MTNTEGGVDPEEFRIMAAIDRVNTTATVWLGTTLGCCQCHSHKFDPFAQKEYYRFLAFFNSGADNGSEHKPELEIPTPTSAADRAEIARLEKLLNGMTPEMIRSQADWERLQAEPVRWAVFEPSRMVSEIGAVLTKLPDKSILKPAANSTRISTRSPGRSKWRA